MILVVFVDDAGIGSKRKEDADNLVQQLVDRGFELTREGTFTEFLGIKFDKDELAGTITLTQQGLIQKIVDTTGMQDCNPNWTPASPMALGSDPDGETMREEWLYSSIVGMLLYLSTNTRPDIAFAVSQVISLQPLAKAESCQGSQDDRALPLPHRGQRNHRQNNRQARVGLPR